MNLFVKNSKISPPESKQIGSLHNNLPQKIRFTLHTYLPQNNFLNNFLPISTNFFFLLHFHPYVWQQLISSNCFLFATDLLDEMLCIRQNNNSKTVKCQAFIIKFSVNKFMTSFSYDKKSFS